MPRVGSPHPGQRPGVGAVKGGQEEVAVAVGQADHFPVADDPARLPGDGAQDEVGERLARQSRVRSMARFCSAVRRRLSRSLLASPSFPGGLPSDEAV